VQRTKEGNSHASLVQTHSRRPDGTCPACSGGCFPASAQTKYTITDLGGNTYPQGVNDSGSVAGHVKYPATRTSAEYRRAFVRINGSQSEIGTLGGKASEAHAINNSNQVVGQSLNAAGAPRAFLYENGVMKDLNLVKGTDGKSAADLYPGWTLEAAYGINNNGQVVGYWTHPSQVPGQGNSFRWQRDAIGNVSVTAVDLLTRQYQTRGINDAGLVAGGVEYIATDGGGIELSTTQASIWQDGAGNTNLGILHADDLVSHANSINNSSEVVGGSAAPSFGRSCGAPPVAAW
jgi:probable HAF family extracellular repeat protein